MEQRNLAEMGAIMENNNLPPLSTALLDTTLVSFTGEQTLYTPTGEVLHMHIYCSPLAIAGEENKRITTPAQVLVILENQGVAA